MNFGKNLQVLRKMTNMTQEKLAEKLNVSRQTISKWELAGESDFRECSCGLQYSYREYRRSYCKNNMPTGAAEKTFNMFIQNWNRAKNYQEKIVLVDTLLHEFHLSLVSGAIHRPAAMNFIDGSRSRVEQIISSLAGNFSYVPLIFSAPNHSGWR